MQVAALEIVVQPERVAQFVHDQFGERLLDHAIHVHLVRRMQAQGGVAPDQADLHGHAHVAAIGVKGGGWLRDNAFEPHLGKDLPVDQPLGEVTELQHDVRPQDFTGAWIDEAGAVTAERRLGRGGPAQHVVIDVAGVPFRIVGLLLNHQRILEAGLLKRLVPFEGGLLDRVAELDGRGVLNPEGDRLHRLAERRAGLSFDQAPAMNEVAPRGGLCAGKIGDLGGEVANARIFVARLVIVVRHADQVVLHLHGDVARISHVFALAFFGWRGAAFKHVAHAKHRVVRVPKSIREQGLALVELAQNACPVGLYLQHAFAQEQGLGGDDVTSVVLGENGFPCHDGVADIGFLRAMQRVLRVKVKGGVLLGELEFVE